MKAVKQNHAVKILVAQLEKPDIDNASRLAAIKGIAAIALARVKLTTLRERVRAKETAQKAAPKERKFGILD